MVSAPRFSIVMPAFNGAGVIHRAIESIVGQSFGDFELVLVDDHSTDNTLAIAEAFAARDSRIKVFCTAVNSGGPAEPKNQAIGKATGEIILFCDQDDCYVPFKLERFDAVFTKYPATELLFSDYWVEHTDRSIERYRYLHDTRQFIDRASAYLERLETNIYVCNRFIGCMCGGVDTGMATISVGVRRTVLLQEGQIFEPSYRVVDDIDLWMRLAAKLQIKYLDEPLSIYVSSPSSLSSRKVIVDAEAVKVHEVAARRFGHLLTASERSKHRALRSRMEYRLACTRFADAPRCLRHALNSWVLSPNWLAAKLVVERGGRWLLRMSGDSKRR